MATRDDKRLFRVHVMRHIQKIPCYAQKMLLLMTRAAAPAARMPAAIEICHYGAILLMRVMIWRGSDVQRGDAMMLCAHIMRLLRY